MSPDTALIPAAERIERVWTSASTDGHGACLIGDAGALTGLVTEEALAAAIEAGRSDQPVGALVETPVVHTHPDHDADIVLDRLAHAGGLLPVVSRDRADRLVGVVTLDGITRYLRRARRGGADPDRRAGRGGPDAWPADREAG
jgi:CBS domain-containing protein